jgi:hypothetical protein
VYDYRNSRGDSGVASFDFDDGDWISVTFTDGSTYTYTYASAGKGNVEFMKRLARQGVGLNGFINLHVKKLYASKGGQPQAPF